MTKKWRDVDQVLRAMAEEYPFDPDDPFEPKLIPINSTESTGDTPLHFMCFRDDVEAVRLLIDAGADVNFKGDMDYTPLHIAVRNSSPEVIGGLLSRGASPRVRNRFGKTPIDIALDRGDQEVLALLSKYA